MTRLRRKPRLDSSKSPRGLLAQLAALAAVLCALIVAPGCNNQTRIVVPNRVLDRPLDLVLTCMKVGDDGQIEALGLNECDNASVPSACTSDGSTQLIGFVANSERNEVAVLRRCDRTAAVVDMDEDAPGYQLVPVGQLPTHITATELGCKVVTANEGSCDLSVLDGPGMAGYALGAQEPTAPSSLISRLVVLRADGTPLGARPGQMLVAPDRLSSARQGISSTDDSGGDDTSGDTAGESDSETDGVGDFETLQCAPDKPESLWMTFPTCQLVAEVNLQNGQILQSRKFLNEADGTVTVVDSGTTPSCPIDCPIQFPDGVPPTCAEGESSPECREAVTDEGYFPVALEFVEPVADEEQLDDAEDEIRYSALFIGGLGSDTIVEMAFNTTDGVEAAAWVTPEETLSLTLERPAGIHTIRATPAVFMDDGQTHQFLYAIAGDGSTHVVTRDFDEGTLGVECDTQIDPTVVPSPFPSCNPIDPNTIGQTPSPDRRPFASGPGIRVSDGAALTDWTFFKVASSEDNTGVDMDGEANPDPPALDGSPASPFATPGLVGVGVTSFGRIVLSIFDQLQAQGRFNTGADPVGVMDVSVPPHSLWPLLNPLSELQALPRVDDEESERALPGADDTSERLAPSVRKVDAAYATPSNPSDTISLEREQLVAALGTIGNADQLTRDDGTGVYENVVPRVVARDYQTWRTAAWSLIWEASIPGTRSSTGRVECENPGWESGTCLPPDPSDPDATGDAKIVDESAAFCDDGVLAGDKVVLLGCSSDDDCGLGQRCLQEPTAPSTATGICISESAFDQEFEFLRQVCAPFITDPCGFPRREFLVTRAFQNEIHIQAMDVPRESYLRQVPADPNDADGDGIPDSDDDFDGPVDVVDELIGRYTCQLPRAPSQLSDDSGNAVACLTDDECTDANPESSEEEPGGYVCTNDGICRGRCPGGNPECFECASDTECSHFGEGALCSDGQCRRPCTPGSRECVQSLLPGPRCFPELIDYVVRTRNSFLVEGDPVAPFISDRVFADPVTGECREDDSVSALLTSRLPLGADEDALLNGDFAIPDCPNPDEAAPGDPNPCRVTIPRAGQELTRYHTMAYFDEQVEAIRFSNPYLSFVLDLTDLESLAAQPSIVNEDGELGEPVVFPPRFADFQRARIPRGYREAFTTISGYIPISSPAVVINTVLVYPVRIVKAPTTNHAFIVDAGGRGGPAGIRGQIIRINAQGIDQGGFEDRSFLVR